jgi:hypothetical protein
MANQLAGKAASESPALKPYWGKPAVRNFRGGNGNVGSTRSAPLPYPTAHVSAFATQARSKGVELWLAAGHRAPGDAH